MWWRAIRASHGDPQRRWAELVFLDVPWTELDGEHLEMAINDYTRRDRRFGGVDS
jgi:undecaprenyl diphosphate synthase